MNCKCVKEALLHRTCHALQLAGHQSTTIASYQSTVRFNTTSCQITFVNCKYELSRLETLYCCSYFAVMSTLVCINIG